MPSGERNQVDVAVCAIPAFLGMKGDALAKRKKDKDAYDIYVSIRCYADGIDALAAACRSIIGYPSAKLGFHHIIEKFSALDGRGPSCVRRFVEEEGLLDGRSPDQWQKMLLAKWALGLKHSKIRKQKNTLLKLRVADLANQSLIRTKDSCCNWQIVFQTLPYLRPLTHFS
jgi:hypothetical protein